VLPPVAPVPPVVAPVVESVVESVVEPVVEPGAAPFVAPVVDPNEPVIESSAPTGSALSPWRLVGLGSLTPAPGLRGIVEVVIAPHTIVSVEGQTVLSVHRRDSVASDLLLGAALLGGIRSVVTPDAPVQLSIGATGGVGLRYTDIFETDSPELLTGAYGGISLAPSVSAAVNVVVEHWLSPWMALRGQVNIASVDWSPELLRDSNTPTGLDLALFSSPAVGVVFVL
jgi:hypothetical protein